MSEFLVLRLDAPLMSFGGVVVDNHGVTNEFPGLSLLAGLLGNALGYEHREFDRLQRLQGSIRYAVRCDRTGHWLRDFQTVDLGQAHLVDTGWTTRGRVEERDGGNSKVTHIRERDYRADSVYTVVLRIEGEGELPSISVLAAALKAPERPLFLGRKACLPAAPLFVGTVSASSAREALEKVPLLVPESRRTASPLKAWWPADEGGDELSSREFWTSDEREWSLQVHTGKRRLREGVITVKESVAHG